LEITIKRRPPVARKHVSLLTLTKHGRRTYELIGPDGRPIQAFSVFADEMLKAPLRTRKSYCPSLADFYDYYFEACHCLANGGEVGLTRSMLMEIVDSWREYLVMGDDSGFQIARDVSLTLPSPRILHTSADTKHAALSRFLKLSEKWRKDTLTLASLGLDANAVDPLPLLSDFGHHVPMDAYQRHAILRSSLLAGVVAGGPVSIKKAIFETEGRYEFDPIKAFPMDSFDNFCDKLTSARDKAIASLELAIGCRSSEGLQLLWEDVDFEKRTIKLVNPVTRPNHSSYLNLCLEDREKLSWKGRSRSDTIPIEPFISHFFHYLEEYHRSEYIPHERHSFVFQILHKKKLGAPYFTTDSKTRELAFKRARDRADISKSVKGHHSFRHSYAIYMLNYCPMLDGTFGAPLTTVQDMLGHDDIKATKKYALRDADLLNFNLQFSNTMAYNKGDCMRQSSLKIEAISAEIRRLESKRDALMDSDAKHDNRFIG
jgi:integrase